MYRVLRSLTSRPLALVNTRPLSAVRFATTRSAATNAAYSRADGKIARPPPTYKAVNPNYAEEIKHAMSLHGFAQASGMRFLKLEPGYAEIEMPVTPISSQHHGTVHGGIQALLADNAAGFAAQTLFAHGTTPVAANLNISFLAPAAGDRLVAAGRVVRKGRTLNVTEFDIFAHTDSTGKVAHCATGTQTTVGVQREVSSSTRQKAQDGSNNDTSSSNGVHGR